TTVNETYELFLGRLRRYPGNYSQYLARRKAELEELSQRYEQQQQEIDRLNTFIQKFRYNASKARQVQSRVKYLEKLELIELPTHMQSIHFTFPPAPHSGKKVLELKNIGKSYGEKEVLQDVSLELRRGEKLVVTGINGAGKSTLLRIIAGVDENFSGELSLGTGVDIGYFSQEQTELESDPSSIIDLVEREAPTSLVPRLRSLLGAFLFQGDDIYKSLQVLSGGERSRIALLRLLLQPHNLLVLDEPTNHLDIHSKDVLLDALQSYNGTLVFVSHDRYFIEHLATRVLQIGGGGARNFPGDYAYYLYRLAQEEAAAKGAPANGGDLNGTATNGGAGRASGGVGAPAATRASAAAGAASGTRAAAQGRDIGYQQSKQIKNRLRKLESEETAIMERIESLEQSHLELQERMALPEVYADGEQIRELQNELKSNEQQHDELSRRWEAILEEKESLQQEYNR
ncbi:MAG: ATP-binding cassette domain-containing protein, partial [Spirochaetota bacterium]|nr:ATP-binding cassette domain-containing protein [Spirochaetota bacterium]